MAAITALENTLYRERLPNPYLSKTFQSNVLHTPSYTDRRTVSNENFSRKIVEDVNYPKPPWGRKYSYAGGVGYVKLQGTPNSLDMINLSRGTHHFGSGASQKPRGVTVQQLYSITPTMRSKVRPSDELVQSPTKVNLSNEQIDRKFPAEHPYTSHISRTAMFPSTTLPKSRTNMVHYDDKENDAAVLAHDSPASAPDSTIIGKARGTPYRHELISVPLDSRRKPMTWPGPTYFQVLKGPDRERNVYYPIPPSQLNPNSLQFKKLSEETEQALEEVNKEKWRTTYQRDYYKPQTPINNLDTEETLSEITASQHAEAQTALLHRNVQSRDDTQAQERSEKELSAEAERKKRVQFVNVNDIPKDYDQKQNHIIPTPPMYLTSRPFSTTNRNKNVLQNALTITERSKTAPVSRITTAARLFSNTDLRRKFNATYDQSPDLSVTRIGGKTLAERRHYVPEANGARTYVFDGY